MTRSPLRDITQPVTSDVAGWGDNDEVPELTPLVPTERASLAWWQKADAGVTNAAGACSNWADQSGRGVILTQGTGANRPLISTINGNISLLGDGVNDVLRDSSSALDLSAGYTYAAVITPTIVTGTNANAFRGRLVDNTNQFSLVRNTTGLTAFQEGGAAADLNLVCAGVMAVDTTIYAIVRVAPGGPSDMITSNGGSATGTGPATLTNAITDLMAFANVTTLLWTGHIHEILLFEEVFSDELRDRLELYLEDRWVVS
jgi:hypothetical protein